MRRVFVVALCCAFVLSLAAVPALAQDSSHSSPLIPTGWTIDPAGHEFGVSQTDRGFVGPLGAALSPDGSQLLAASGGAARIQSADLFDLSSRQRSDYVPYDGYQGQSTFYGVVFSPNGTRAWAAGGPPITLAPPLFPLKVPFTRRENDAFIAWMGGRAVSGFNPPPPHKTTDVTLSPLTDPLQADHRERRPYLQRGRRGT